MQGHLKINVDLFGVLCPPQLHKNDFYLPSLPVDKGSALGGFNFILFLEFQ
jgi:hypothetical protein